MRPCDGRRLEVRAALEVDSRAESSRWDEGQPCLEQISVWTKPLVHSQKPPLCLPTCGPWVWMHLDSGCPSGSDVEGDTSNASHA